MSSPVKRLTHSGFSLVEVSLALLVVAVGILSVLSLFPAGLDQGARSEAETHASQFAEEVFGGLRAWAETDFAGLTNFSVPGAVEDVWEGSRDDIGFTGTNAVRNLYIASNIVNHAFRYRLTVTNVNDDRSIMSGSLYVYPGQFGALSNAIFFYTEFYDFGR